MLQLEWYRIFYQTSKTKNLTKAAQQLFITQPSVSYAIKQMEKALGVKLFNRLSKGVELTQEGRELFLYVEQSMAMLEAGEKKIQELKQLKTGELRIGASDTMIKQLMLPYFDRFHARYPDIRLRVAHGSTSEIIQFLKEGRVDIGVVRLPAEDPLIEVQEFARVQDTFVAGPAFRHLAEKPITISQMKDIPLITLIPGSNTRRYLEQLFAAHGIEPKFDFVLSNVDLMVEFAKRNLGITLVARSFVQKELASGGLVELRTVEPIPPRSIGIAKRRGATLPLASERFVEMISGEGRPRPQTKKAAKTDRGQ